MPSGSKIDVSDALTIDELMPLLRTCIEVKMPAFLWAGPGVGKSSIIRQLADEVVDPKTKAHGVCVDMRLSQMSPTDIIGIPFKATDTITNEAGEKVTVEVMRFAPPSRLPSATFAKKYPLVILFLDEMSSAPPSVQAAAYELVLDRRCGEYVLPDNVVVFAAGNRESDRGVTYRMATPLANRFVHFELKPDFDSWLNWAIPANVHADVISYLSAAKASLYDFDPNGASRSFPTPRSWEFVSNFLRKNTPDNPMTDSAIRVLVGSAVGSGESVKFMNYLKIGKDLPKPADILSGKVKELKTKEISAHYQLIVNCLHEMREYWHSNSVPTEGTSKVGNKPVQQRKWNNAKLEDKWVTMFDTFNTFIITQIPLEIGIMAMRMAVANYYFSVSTDMTQLKTWPKMAEKYFAFMKDA